MYTRDLFSFCKRKNCHLKILQYPKIEIYKLYSENKDTIIINNRKSIFMVHITFGTYYTDVFNYFFT